MPDETICRPEICNYETQKLLLKGECEDCPSYERGRGGDGKTCGPDECTAR